MNGIKTANVSLDCFKNQDYFKVSKSQRKNPKSSPSEQIDFQVDVPIVDLGLLIQLLGLKHR